MIADEGGVGRVAWRDAMVVGGDDLDDGVPERVEVRVKVRVEMRVEIMWTDRHFASCTRVTTSSRGAAKSQFPCSFFLRNTTYTGS